MVKITFSIIVALLAVSLTCCANGITQNPPTATTSTPASTRTPLPTPTFTPPRPTFAITLTENLPTPAPMQVLMGPYLGQEPPGSEPRLFAPGFVSNPGSNEYSGSFSPDGSEYYFYRFSDDSPARLLFTRLVDGRWKDPEEPDFSMGMRAYEPYVTTDNQRLYFATMDYPVPASHPAGQPAYVFVERTSGGWTEPEYAGQGMFISSSRNGQIYITDMSSRNSGGSTYLAKVTVSEGRFTEYERLQIESHWGRQAHPCIALDESYIIFTVKDGSYLYVSFIKEDGLWGEAIDLTQHGFDPQAGGPYISPDGKYLFFALHGDIWWVDISVVEDLRPVK